jgi:hypothetical protein
MRIACWLPNSTNTHSQYAIIINFPLQQWLHESSSTLLCTYIACLLKNAIANAPKQVQTQSFVPEKCPTVVTTACRRGIMKEAHSYIIQREVKNYIPARQIYFYN